MSRNARIQHSLPPARGAKHRGSDYSPSPLQLSGDDGYSGVEDISDSDEDDDHHVNVAEEEHLTQSSSARGSTSPRPQDHYDADEEELADEDEDEETRQFIDEDNAGLSWNPGPTEVEASKARFSQESELANHRESVGGERRVRFTGVSDSDTDSTTSDADAYRGIFPDIFEDHLDAKSRSRIEPEENDSDRESLRWSQYHRNNPLDESDCTPMMTPAGSTAPTAASSPIATVNYQELDGYESDGYTTTTEDDRPVPIARNKQIWAHSPALSESDSDAQRRQPRLGRYNLDDSEKKPIAVLNPMTRKMMIFTPQRRHHLDLSPESFNLDVTAQAHAGFLKSSPITSNQASLRMSTMVSSNTFGDIMNSQPFGPVDAYLPVMPELWSDPFPMVDHDSSKVEDNAGEEEQKVDLSDFITFNPHESGDDEHQGEQGEEDDSWPEWKHDEGGDATMTPSRPNTALDTAPSTTCSPSVRSDTPTVHPLLSHFSSSSDTVGAFRRSQINQQLILSNKASQDSLAFSGPLHYGTLRGIRSDSMKTIMTPITPIRRPKPSQSGIAIENDTPSVDPFEDLESSPSIFMSRKRHISSEYEEYEVPGKKMRLLDDDISPW